MCYLFGECEFDTERYELRRAGQVVALAPMAVRVLAYFVQHPGQAVAKSALLQEFWPGAAEESYKEYSLRNCLTKIRRAVGDAGTPRAVIETVQRYGYRFAAEVTVLPTASRPAGDGGPGKTDDTVSHGAEPAVPPAAVVQCPQCQTPPWQPGCSARRVGRPWPRRVHSVAPATHPQRASVAGAATRS